MQASHAKKQHGKAAAAFAALLAGIGLLSGSAALEIPAVPDILFIQI